MNLSPDPLVRIMELFSDPTFLMGYFIIASMTLAMCCFACAIFWMGKFYEAYKERSRRLEAVAMAFGEMASQMKNSTEAASTMYMMAQSVYSDALSTYPEKGTVPYKTGTNSKRPQA